MQAELSDRNDNMKESQVNNEKVDSGLNSYRNIIKGSSFFGGVQLFNIIITLLRGKFVAVILGPEGMGIAALFNSASNTIQRVASFGLPQSITREVAESPEEKTKKVEIIKTSIRLANITALVGLVVCAAFCIPLSRITFGDESYWWQFIMLGAAVAFGLAGTGKLSILQGLHEVKKISYSSVVGGLAGLGIGIPLYYLFGDKGIVPAIVAIFLSLYIFYSFSLKRSFSLKKESGNWKEFLPVAKKIVSLGIILMSGDMIATLVGYLINLYIRINGSLDDVGLYQAAVSVTKQFSGMIFAVLAMDYFPRLSKVASNNFEMKTAVNRQSEIVAWLMTPAMTLLILSTPLLITILLSQNFHPIIPLMRWMGLGMLLRAFSYPMAYITFAKGNKKVYFLLEGICANLLTLVLSCLFFHWFGLIGLGYALVADNGICILLYYIVNNHLYGYSFSPSVSINYLFGSIMVGGCFVFSSFSSRALSYTLMSCITLISIIWAFYYLKSRFKD